uniref:salicylic acid-binding protein 2-like n=1 Tax=Erigeron canadensis TaxID=72917 RepID=UPI001CB9CDE0|nr:salicylic acid-binding protein 2-like [Erigeron canadensis]
MEATPRWFEHSSCHGKVPRKGLCCYLPHRLYAEYRTQAFLCYRAEGWLDTQFLPYEDENVPNQTILFGPNMLSSKLYQLCSIEDLELGKILTRPGSLFVNDLQNSNEFTKEIYGIVKRVFVLCDEDKLMKDDFQKWMIDNSPAVETKELKGVDHMAMLSDPKQLSVCLLDIALRLA